jgi:hypothetical protein
VLPLKKREFDLQHNVSAAATGGSLVQDLMFRDLHALIIKCSDFKRVNSLVNNAGQLSHLDHLDAILAEWAKRDAPYSRKNPALFATRSALRLVKEWVTRVVGVPELESSAVCDPMQRHNFSGSHQAAIERVLLQQRCAVSEWLKHENSNKDLFDAIKKKFEAACDASGSGDEQQVSVVAIHFACALRSACDV